jgi:hypothetical protein
MPGTITLYNSQGVRLCSMRYHTHKDRGRILKGWEKTYEDRIKTFYYQLSPDIDERKIVSELNRETLHGLKKAS